MKKQLWLRLKGYYFDNLVPDHLVDRVIATFGGADASTRAFAGKISHKLGWRMPFALRAIDEYRKFVYLGIVSDTQVTPPKVIDQVWHEHLLFSKAYREFCHEVLGRDFDHHPELLPTPGQTEVFEAQYAATLALYETEFNVRPPSDIWGTPKFDVRRPARAPEGMPSVDEDPAMAHEDRPLHQLFDGSGQGSSHHTLPEFGGGGGFSGSGGGSTWSGDHGSHHGAEGGHAADSAHGDGGGSGDSGSSDGGSGCSSSCGGGCSG